MAHPEAAIFDFDFTLADSSKPIVECVIRALGQLGFPAPLPERVLDTIGLSLPDIFAHFAGSTDVELAMQFTRFFHARADQIMEAGTKIYDSVHPMMQTLRAAHIRMGIVTTKLNYRIRNILVANRLEKFVDVIVGADDVRRTKPDPEGLLIALQQLRASPGSAVYVGDHLIDAQAASSCGVPFVATLSGRHPREAFESLPHIAIMESICELPRVLSLS